MTVKRSQNHKAKGSDAAARIQTLRKKSGIETVSEFADKLKSARSLVSQLESGARTLSPEMCINLGNFALARGFYSDALWFYERAGISHQAMLAAGREAATQRGVPIGEAEAAKLPVMRKTARGFEETGLSVKLSRELVTDSTMCFAAENARVRYGFAAGKIIVLDTSLNEREMSKAPMAIVIEFRPRPNYEGLGDLEKSIRKWEELSQGLFLGEVRVNPGQPRTLDPMKWEVEFSRLTDDPSVIRMTQSPPSPIALGSGMQHEREAGTAKVELNPQVRLIGKVVAILPPNAAVPGEMEDSSTEQRKRKSR